MSTPLDFNPLDFFQAEIKNDNASIKINAVNSINLIASALGPERTVRELIPLVVQAVTEEPLCNDDEFLYCMAKQYAVLMDYTGGQEELLLAPLEHLASQEETVIRDEAISSLCTIIQKKPNLTSEYLVPTLHRLSTKTDFFTARVSACALFPTVYKYAKDEEKESLRKAYITICADDTPMVRRAAANKMKAFVEVCEKEDLLTDLINSYKQLSQEDTQDSIRVACVNTTLVIARMLNPEENKEHTVKVILEAAQDRSWRVRLTVAKSFDQFCAAFGPEITATSLIPAIKQLMQDHEQEVRRESVKIIQACLNMPVPMPNDQLQNSILSEFQRLSVDPAQPVRAALASIMGPVAQALGREITQRQLLPLISDLMKDEFHDVRLYIVGHAGLLCEVLGVDGLVHSLLHTIQSLIMDNHWRIRQSVVEQVPKLARLFGVDMFQSKLEALFLSSLRDSVHSVRQAAISNLHHIAISFGQQWTAEHLMPKIMEQYSQSAGYANRVTTLQVLPQVATVMNATQVTEYIIPLIIKALNDAVPNVRFCACRVLITILESSQSKTPGDSYDGGGQLALADIKSKVLVLKDDTDCDVQYYAQRALAKC